MATGKSRVFAALDPARAPLRLSIGLVNNVPDAALRATERQFLDLLRGAAPGLRVDLRFYALPQVPRSARGREHLRQFYADMDSLWANPPDGLIITGAEPLAADLRDEPYWDGLTRLFDWAGRHTISTLLSCLAAHAGVLHFDGIERRRLARKCSGIFAETVTDHPLTQGLGPVFPAPHSRWNVVEETALRARGYEILTRSDAAGAGLFVRRREALFVFLQGHPEYDVDSLAKEYRRDVGRFLRGESAAYPTLPAGYFDAGSAAQLRDFAARARLCPDEALLADFPRGLALTGAGPSWRDGATALFANWLATIAAEKQRRQGRVTARPDARAA